MKMIPRDFWELTQAEFHAMMKGFERHRTRQINDVLSCSWYTAMLIRQKSIPKLKDLLIDTTKEKKEQTDEEMMAMARMLNAVFGGKEVMK